VGLDEIVQSRNVRVLVESADCYARHDLERTWLKVPQCGQCVGDERGRRFLTARASGCPALDDLLTVRRTAPTALTDRQNRSASRSAATARRARTGCAICSIDSLSNGRVVAADVHGSSPNIAGTMGSVNRSRVLVNAGALVLLVVVLKLLGASWATALLVPAVIGGLSAVSFIIRQRRR
jgi:hypothetical protein